MTDQTDDTTPPKTTARSRAESAPPQPVPRCCRIRSQGLIGQVAAFLVAVGAAIFIVNPSPPRASRSYRLTEVVDYRGSHADTTSGE